MKGYRNFLFSGRFNDYWHFISENKKNTKQDEEKGLVIVSQNRKGFGFF